MENFETFKLDQTGQQTQAILDQVSTNTADIEQLRALYEALTQSEPVIIQPSDTWPVADPQENVIYRVIDRVNTPPQSYSDYMWNGTAMVLMATYNNPIDNEPTPGSNNLVKSGGVAASIVFDISAYHATGSTLATYANLEAALGTDGANVPASVRKGGMSVKFVNSSDNKYVQYRLMSDNWSTNGGDWALMEGDVYIENSLFVSVLTDKKKRILMGILYNGDVIFGCGIPSQIKTSLLNKVDKVEGYSLIDEKLTDIMKLVDCPEWVDINVDSKGRIIEGTKLDGTKIIEKLQVGKFVNPQVFFNYITVDKSGNGDYATLTEAADKAEDGSVIIVMPGVYENEQMAAGETKELHIIGVDREQCIIKNNSGLREKPALDFSSGNIRNLTIISEATSGNAYCIHMDNHNMKDSSISIENCTLINMSEGYSNGCVGIGLRGGCVLNIRNCTLSAPNATSGQALYSHDNDWPDAQYNGLQQLKVTDCIIDCPNASAISIQGQGTPTRDFTVSQYYIEFVRNRLLGGANFVNFYNDPGTITADDFQGVKNLRLSEISWGNSNNILNN